jgi:hypothetical protein
MAKSKSGKAKTKTQEPAGATQEPEVVVVPARTAKYVSPAMTAIADGNKPKCIVCGKYLASDTSIVRGVGGTCISLVSRFLPDGKVLAAPSKDQVVAENGEVDDAVAAARAWLSPLRVVGITVPVTTVEQYGIPAGTPFVTVKVVHWQMHANKVPTSLMVRAFGGDRARNKPFVGAKADWSPTYVGRSRFLHPACNTPAAWSELQQASAQGLLPK